MKRYLPFIIIVFILAAAVGTVVILSKNGSGNSATSPTFVPPNQPATPNGAQTPSNQSSPEAAPVTKPNVKVTSPVVVLSTQISLLGTLGPASAHRRRWATRYPTATLY